MAEIKRVAVFTSGGDSPGMNAAIRAVVRTASFHDLHIYGIRRGYEGMIENDFLRMESHDVSNIIHLGGTIIKTARSKDFMTKEGRTKAFENLVAHDIDACIAIGGEGTYTGAEIFSSEYKIPFIGIPGTIDNDLFGTDNTIGFDTSINTAIDAVDKIRDTANSHNRLFFIEVMGRQSGYIALHTGLGTGAASILIPEIQTSIDNLVKGLKQGMVRERAYSIIIVAEGNRNGGAAEIAEKVLAIYEATEAKVAVIGHLQRGGSPTAADRLLASRLGYAAIEGLLEGKKNVGVGLINNKVVYTPFKRILSTSKSLDIDLIKMAEILAHGK